MSIYSKRLKASIALILTFSLAAHANEFDKQATRYIENSHKTAKSMADALFVNDLINAFLLSISGEQIQGENLNKTEKSLQATLQAAMNLKESEVSPQSSLRLNKRLLEKTVQLRTEMGLRVAQLHGTFRQHENIVTKRQNLLLNAMRIQYDNCEKGRAHSPINAGLTMPRLLENGFNLRFNYSFNMESPGNGTAGGGVDPNTPYGDPEVFKYGAAAATTAAAYGGPVGWGISAGIMVATYLYSSEEKRKAEIDMTDAFLRQLNEMATATDVKNAYIGACKKRTTLIRDVISSLESELFPNEIFETLRTTQSENLKTFEKIASQITEKGNSSLAKFFTDTLKQEDLVDLTLYSLLLIAKDDNSRIEQIQENMLNSNQYDLVLKYLDGKIRNLQKANYILSLLEQDQQVLEKLILDESLFISSENLIREWQVLFAKKLSQNFATSGYASEKNQVRDWVNKLSAIKDKLPTKVQQSFEKRLSLLTSE